MHIILDSNIYAADYRMSGVSFRTFFEYMRRTRATLVLPNAIREEVVNDYGRRLKSESKDLAPLWNRYRHLQLDSDPGVFQKPDLKRAMATLRRKLMNPQEGVKPKYVPELKGNFLQEAFMRGVKRIRPASREGEELRDVILWLWALEYCDSVGDKVAFVSNDSGFWDKDGLHAQIAGDAQSKQGKIAVYRSIDDFLQQHSPAPTDATPEWFRKNVQIQAIESQLVERALRQLSRLLRGQVRSLIIESCEFEKGKVYQVADDTQFAELNLRVLLKFQLVPEPIRPIDVLYFGVGAVLGADRNTPLNSPLGSSEPKPTVREANCVGRAAISVRVKMGEPSEISADKLTINQEQLWSLQLTETSELAESLSKTLKSP